MGEASRANGVYRPTSLEVHSRTAYRRTDGDTLWLCYDALDETWKVVESLDVEDRALHRGYVRSPATEWIHPAVEGSWQVWAACGSGWQVQHSISVMPALPVEESAVRIEEEVAPKGSWCGCSFST